MQAEFDLKRTDALLHAPARLALMAMLAGGAEIEFTALRDQLDLTDGNLASHLRKLEDAGYLRCAKSFLGRRPRTAYTILSKGRSSLARHVAELERIVATSRENRRSGSS